MDKPRLLIVTSNPPMDEMGGCMLLYRQFVQRSDFEIFVVTDRLDYKAVDHRNMILSPPKMIARLMRTRFSLFGHDWMHLVQGNVIPRDLWREVQNFKPDAVITGAETWLSDLGGRMARRLRVPLVSYFMDWPSFGTRGHRRVKRFMSTQFRRRYRECDLAFGICPEMLEELGPHKNAKVFYPMGSKMERMTGPSQSQNSPFTLLFAGNLGQWYGPMLLDLADYLQKNKDVQLRIAGKNAEWGTGKEMQLSKEGVFLGFLKGDAYHEALSGADALLVIMGFGVEDKLVESTSFKSKMADYLGLGLPLIVWGPDYCTASRHAQREGFGLVVNSPDPDGVADAMTRLRDDPALAKELSERGQDFFHRELNAEVVLKNAYQEIINLLPMGGENER